MLPFKEKIVVGGEFNVDEYSNNIRIKNWTMCRDSVKPVPVCFNFE